MTSRFNRYSTAEEVTRDIDLSGRTALVTGAGSGIGAETVRVLALRGAHVFAAARTLDKAKRAADGVSGPVTPLGCDLTDLVDVRRCADQVAAKTGSVDMLIANAGILLPALTQVRGIETTFATNHLGHFLLANLLIGHIRACRGRVVVVSSGGHKRAPPGGIRFDDLGGEQSFSPFGAYCQSKLANILFAAGLNRRLAGDGTANAVDPGAVATALARRIRAPLRTRVLWRLIAPFVMKDVARGAATQCWAATSPSLEGIGGRYFADCREARASATARDDDLADRLWDVSTRLVGLA